MVTDHPFQLVHLVQDHMPVSLGAARLAEYQEGHGTKRSEAHRSDREARPDLAPRS
jgi:hypothetical protein